MHKVTKHTTHLRQLSWNPPSKLYRLPLLHPTLPKSPTQHNLSPPFKTNTKQYPYLLPISAINISHPQTLTHRIETTTNMGRNTHRPKTPPTQQSMGTIMDSLKSILSMFDIQKFGNPPSHPRTPITKYH